MFAPPANGWNPAPPTGFASAFEEPPNSVIVVDITPASQPPEGR